MRLSDEDYVSVSEWAAKRWLTGKASKYIDPFNVKPGDRVYLAVRKSNWDVHENLQAQARHLRAIVESCGGIVVGTHQHVGSGFDCDWIGFAAGKARRAGAEVLLAECTDRFVRNHHYHSVERWRLQATDEDLRELAWCANGMRLMTHLHPDASPEEARAYQSKRGQQMKNRVGGRPIARRPGYKKRKRLNCRKGVRQALKRGWSIRQIAARFRVPKSTVHRWILE